MKLVLVNVSDDRARSCISATGLKVGSIVKLKGLADKTLAVKSGVALDGEIFEAVTPDADDPNDLFAIAAPDVVASQRYKEEDRWNFSDYADIEAKEPFRGYILRRGDRVKLEKTEVTGTGVVKGDKLAVAAGATKLAKVVGAEKAIVAMVLGECKIDGTDAYDIIFL